jgi:hypothetical protein
MVKKFTVNCDFSGQIAPFTIYLGDPEREHHPLHFQAEWLSKTRGGTIPGQVMDAISKLKALAEKNKVSFEELCVYALGAAEQEMDQSAASEDSEPESIGSTDES